MKRLILSIFVLTLIFACGPLPSDQAESNVGITAPDGYSVACITGFVRITPHNCALRTATPTIYTATLDNTCRSFDLSSGSIIVPVGTKYIQGIAAFLINSANATGIRSIAMSWFLDSSCVTQFGASTQTIREMVAVAAGTQLLNPNVEVTIPLVNQIIYYKGFTSGGTGTIFSLIPLNYFD